jgi:hypothetical protein
MLLKWQNFLHENFNCREIKVFVMGVEAELEKY